MKFNTSSSLLVLTTVVALAFAGCGSSGGDSTATSGGGGSGSTTTSGGGAEGSNAQEAIDTLTKGTYGSPPKAPKPEAGKKILVVSCGQSVVTCSEAAEGAMEAAQKVGWQAKVFDTKGDPSQGAAAIRQAIVEKDDGVVVELLDCRYIKEALLEAKEHNLPVMATESLDCNHGDSTEAASFSAVQKYQGGGEYPEWIKKYGEIQGDLAIAKTGGDAKVISFYQKGVSGVEIQAEGLSEALEKCSSCENYQVEYTFGDMETGLQAKTEQALLQHPDANAVYVAYDGVMLSGVSTAVKAAQASGREIVLVAAEGDAATMTLVREGVVAGGIGIPMAWDGWGGIEGLNRIFHGEPTVTSGIGYQVYDKEHNTPASGSFQPPVNFRAAYEKAWGLG